MRNVQDWNKYVDMLGKAVAKHRLSRLPLSSAGRAAATRAGCRAAAQRARARDGKKRGKNCCAAWWTRR